MRPLPQASSRPITDGPARFVDSKTGDDNNPGTKSKPWKTLAHAVPSLKAGETLYLRAGRYYESVTISLKGTEKQLITIRAFPGEQVIIDAGYREFYEAPATAWEPVPNGGKQEFRSRRPYKTGGNFGNFADSMVPFQRYITFHDLRSNNELWHRGLSNRADDPVGIYAGPGVRRDPKSGRIHIRLTHTKLAGLGKNHYRGETDPRKIPLVIAGSDYGIQFKNANHIRLQDVVVRGASRSAVMMIDSRNIQLDGVTLYGSGSAIRTQRTEDVTITHSALRGHAAPWHSRSHHKDRGPSGYLLVAGGKNFEIAHCELTDHHDCVLFKDAYGVRFHHNFVDNFNDDGIEPGPKKTHGIMLIYQNVISRCLSPFTAHGKFQIIRSQPGSGLYIFRNIVDLRRGTYKAPPTTPDPTGAFLNKATTILAHDHGSPTWPVAYIYHNTFLMTAKPWRGYYGLTWGTHLRGTKRRVFNNIFVQADGVPGMNFSGVTSDADFQADGNLHWSVQGDFRSALALREKFRKTKQFEESQKTYPPGWTTHDLFANPQFKSFFPDLAKPSDFGLKPSSPAIDAGVPIPQTWPDDLRKYDRGKPDIGAIPLGISMKRFGPQSPLTDR
ncbi:MAG: hypothetical protein Tsb009_18470 [Planctomycetaceae bacterium]